MNSDMPANIEDLEWFHPGVGRHMAESILLQNGVDGTYLLRNSSKQGEYALSVRCNISVKHFSIICTSQGYKFGHGTFKNVTELEHHFSNKPLIGGQSAQVTLLSYPYPRNIAEPDAYETICIHAEFSTADVKDKELDFSINSKEGYLTKLGTIFKTWRTRWFVLQKHELKYYQDKSSKEPIRILDLNQCRSCDWDESCKAKSNVFKLVFDWRVFFIYALSKQESQEWMDIINWKLKNRSQ